MNNYENLNLRFIELQNENNIIKENYKIEKDDLIKENNLLKISKDLYESQINELQSNLNQQKEFYDKLFGKIGIDECKDQKNDQNYNDFSNEKKILEERIRDDKVAYEKEISLFSNKIKTLEIDKLALQSEVQRLNEYISLTTIKQIDSCTNHNIEEKITKYTDCLN